MSNVPKLRFKGFEREWLKKNLSDLLKVNSGRDYKHLGKGDIPVFGTGGYMLSVDECLSDIDAIGIGRKGSIDKPQYLEAPFWTVDTLFYCTSKDNIDLYFLNILFQTIKWKKYDESTGVPSLSKKTIEKIVQYAPLIDEQQKIGGFFKGIDNKIQKQQEKIELLKEQKKGYMQKIFNRELRFKDENGGEYPDGKEYKIKNILKEFIEKTTENGQFPIVSSTSTGLYLQSEYFKKQVASKNTTGYKILKRNQIVLSPQNLWMGNINFNNKFDVGIVSPSYKVFDIESDDFSEKFIAHLLRTPWMMYNYKISSEQGASIVRRNLDMNSFYRINVKIPEKREQEKIAEFLKLMEQKIEKEKNYLNEMREQKKGFMQQMFV